MVLRQMEISGENAEPLLEPALPLMGK
jgi:hypothetical protein